MAISIKNLFRKSAPAPTPEIVPPGMCPMGSYEPGDVFILGFPKSGHTWMQNLMAEVLYGAENAPGLPKPISELVPDIHFCKFYARSHEPMFFKAHALPAPEFKRVVYLLRDGRDVMVSYWHFLEAMQKRPLDLLHLVKTAEGFFPPCKWHEHVQQWRANPFGAEILTVRYEDLKADGVRELQRVCAFARVERERGQLERAVRRSSFENMQRREKERGMLHPEWPKDKLFVRRGEVGSYRDEMPPAVQEAFLAEAGPLLRQLGYIRG